MTCVIDNEQGSPIIIFPGKFGQMDVCLMLGFSCSRIPFKLEIVDVEAITFLEDFLKFVDLGKGLATSLVLLSKDGTRLFLYF